MDKRAGFGKGVAVFIPAYVWIDVWIVADDQDAVARYAQVQFQKVRTSFESELKSRKSILWIARASAAVSVNFDPRLRLLGGLRDDARAEKKKQNFHRYSCRKATLAKVHPESDRRGNNRDKWRHDLRKPASFKLTFVCEVTSDGHRLQLRKSNAVIGKKGEAPSLVDRDLGDHFPLVALQDFTSTQQAQFARLEHGFSQLLNFRAHSLKSRINCSVVHKSWTGMQKYLQHPREERDAGKVTALLPW
jgi:hypothetical protein